MTAPYDYIGDLPNPAAQITQGLQSGMALAQGAQQMRLQREQAAGLAQVREAQIAENQAQAAKIQQDMARAQARNTKIAGMVKEGVSASGITNLIAEFPEIAEHYKPALEQLNAKEKQARFEQMAPVLAAVNAGDNSAVQDQMSKMINGYSDAGKTKEAEAAQQWLSLFQRNPEQGKLIANVSMAALIGPDKFESTFGGLETARREQELQPEKLRKLAGEAKEAEVKGTYAEQREKAEIGLKGAQSSAAYASAKASLAEAEARTASAKKTLEEATTEAETRNAKRDLMIARADEARSRANMVNFKSESKAYDAASTALDTTSETLNTIKRLREIISKPASGITSPVSALRGKDVLTGITGPVSSILPSLGEDARDAEALLSQLTAQAFLNKIPAMKGTGPISNKESDRLAASAGNLSLKQTPDNFLSTLKEMESRALRIQSEAQEKVTKFRSTYESKSVSLPSGFTYTVEGK